MKNLTLAALSLALAMPLASSALAHDDDDRAEPPDHESHSQMHDERDRTRLDADEAETLRWLEAEDPDFHTYIIDLRSAEPVQYEREMLRAHQMKQLASDDPELFGKVRMLEKKQLELAARAQDFDRLKKRQQRDRREELTELAEEIVGLRQEVRHARLAQIRDEIEQMERQLAQEALDRDRLAEELVDRAVSGELQSSGYGEAPSRMQRPDERRGGG